MTGPKKQIGAIAIVITMVLSLSVATAFPPCTGTLEVVFPQWMSSSTGLTCCADPKGFNEALGTYEDNTPATPPGDAIWVKGTPNLFNCFGQDCKVFTRFEIFNAAGMKLDEGTDPDGSHPADGEFHRI